MWECDADYVTVVQRYYFSNNKDYVIMVSVWDARQRTDIFDAKLVPKEIKKALEPLLVCLMLENPDIYLGRYYSDSKPLKEW